MWLCMDRLTDVDNNQAKDKPSDEEENKEI